MKRTGSLLFAFAFLSFSIVFAHSPIVSEKSGLNMKDAVTVKNIEISQVLYRAFDRENEFLWMTFEAKKGENLYFQPGIPKLEKFRDLKPTVVIVGPGLPKAENLPFEIPSGNGALIFRSEATPTVFHEPFTDTDSWIFFTKEITLPETGRYYMVSYFPSGKIGNFFIAVGKKEYFTFEDISNTLGMLPEIRALYGLKGYPNWVNAIVGGSFVLLILLFGFLMSK